MADLIQCQNTDNEESSDDDTSTATDSSDFDTTDTEVYECPDEGSINNESNDATEIPALPQIELEDLCGITDVNEDVYDSDTDEYEPDKGEHDPKDKKRIKKSPKPYFPNKRVKYTPNQCKTCQETFNSRKECNAHMKEKNHYSQYTCEYCGKSYKLEAYLKFHLMSHTGEGLNFKCELCGKSFATKGNLETHTRWHMVRVRNETNAVVRPFICEFCGANFRHTTDLKRHLKLHSGLRPHVCDVCCKAFKSRANLNSHKETHKDVKPYICDICGIAMKRNTNLINHMYAIHKVGSPPNRKPTNILRFKCDRCSDKFETQQQLTSHEEQVHGEVRRFPCDICGQDYISIRVMKQHRKKHDPNAISFCCSECGKSCARKVDLNKHMLIHGKKTLPCPYCEQKFHTKANMREHLMMHTGIFPYKCSKCTKGFSATSKLTKHLGTHSKEPNNPDWNNMELNYQCGFCMMCFPDDSEVKAHNKTCESATKWDAALSVTSESTNIL